MKRHFLILTLSLFCASAGFSQIFEYDDLYFTRNDRSKARDLVEGKKFKEVKVPRTVYSEPVPIPTDNVGNNDHDWYSGRSPYGFNTFGNPYGFNSFGNPYGYNSWNNPYSNPGFGYNSWNNPYNSSYGYNSWNSPFNNNFGYGGSGFIVTYGSGWGYNPYAPVNAWNNPYNGYYNPYGNFYCPPGGNNIPSGVTSNNKPTKITAPRYNSASKNYYVAPRNSGGSNLKTSGGYTSQKKGAINSWTHPPTKNTSNYNAPVKPSKNGSAVKYNTDRSNSLNTNSNKTYYSQPRSTSPQPSKSSGNNNKRTVTKFKR